MQVIISVTAAVVVAAAVNVVGLPCKNWTLSLSSFSLIVVMKGEDCVILKQLQILWQRVVASVEQHFDPLKSGHVLHSQQMN